MGKRAMPLLPSEPLARFNVVRARAPDKLLCRIAPLYAVSKLDLSPSRFRFDAVLNHHKLREIALSYARYGAPVKISMTNTDFYTQGFGVRGYGEAVSDGRLFIIANGQGGAAGPGATALLDYRANFEHVFLRIPPEALNRKLAALLGTPPGRPLKLTGEYDKASLQAQFRFLCFVISEIDRSPDGVPQLLLDEFEQALIVAYLCANLNNYSDLLTAKPSPTSPWQVERAIDYIEANWDQPLTVEALASATETSARSLFATFQKSRGYSPMAFVRHVRLSRAREILSQPAPDTSVASVASRCGFHNQSHFAKKYFARFGELPSETLTRTKRGTDKKEI